MLGDGALAADLLGASFAPVAASDAAAALAAPPFALAPWHPKKAGFKAASAPWVALGWASTVATWQPVGGHAKHARLGAAAGHGGRGRSDARLEHLCAQHQQHTNSSLRPDADSRRDE